MPKIFRVGRMAKVFFIKTFLCGKSKKILKNSLKIDFNIPKGFKKVWVGPKNIRVGRVTGNKTFSFLALPWTVLTTLNSFNLNLNNINLKLNSFNLSFQLWNSCGWGKNCSRSLYFEHFQLYLEHFQVHSCCSHVSKSDFLVMMPW